MWRIRDWSSDVCSSDRPMLNLVSVTGGVFLPKDGQADPASITHALAKAARQNGVAIVEHCKVTGIAQANGRVTGVETEHGSIAADTVVNCAGLGGRPVGLMAGVGVPLQAPEHFYVVTAQIPEMPRDQIRQGAGRESGCQHG